MKKILILILLLAAAGLPIFAQKGTTENDEMTKTRREMVKEFSTERRDMTVSSITAAEVGEADSFNKNAKFLGVAQSGYTLVYHSCDPAIILLELETTLGPDDRCLAAPNPAISASATFVDMARITIPARTVSNIVYMINNHSINWEFENPTAGNIFGQMSYSPRVTIESVALNDPAAIDPNTGFPMNGAFTTGGSGTKFQTNSLIPGEFASFVESYSRANTLGFSREYFRSLGLSDSIINGIFRNPLTIRLGMRVGVRGVPFGQYVYTARFLGN